jgi:D-3-phosphoglycerate dehydrogenase
VKHEREGDYHTLVRLTIVTEKFTRDIAGTLFAEKRPRLVQIKGINVDAELGPHMLYVTNEDKPGMIGNLGTVLGENKINIATFALGRSAPGQDAIALIEIDGAIPPEVLDKVRRLPNVRQAKALVF